MRTVKASLMNTIGGKRVYLVQHRMILCPGEMTAVVYALLGTKLHNYLFPSLARRYTTRNLAHNKDGVQKIVLKCTVPFTFFNIDNITIVLYKLCIKISSELVVR
jgi:hypothetical protein